MTGTSPATTGGDAPVPPIGEPSSDGVGTGAVVGVAGLALVVGLVAGGVGTRRAATRRDDAVPPDRPSHHEPPRHGAAADAVAERRRLVWVLIELGDQVSSAALRSQVTEHLESVGVTPLHAAVGERFDPDVHRGVQAARARSPRDDGTVAGCDRPGWRDGDEVLRVPDVIVNRWEGE